MSGAGCGRRGCADTVAGCLRGLDGERQVQHDGAPIVARQVICAGGSGDGVFGGLDPHSDCTDGIGQTVLVDIEVRALFRDLGGKHEQRCAALRRLRDAGHSVGEAATLVHGDCGYRAAHPRVGVGHCRRPAFVPCGDETSAA